MVRQKLAKLKAIQKIDLDNDKIELKIKMIPESLLGVKEKLDASALTLEEFKKTLCDIQEQRGKLEFEIQETQNELKKAEERANSVRTPKEYQASMREVSSLKQRLKESEEALLKALDVIQKLDEKIKEEEGKYQQIKADYDQKSSEAKAQIEELRAGIAETAARRQELATEIGPELMARYERIRAQRNGIGVVDVVNMTCLGCYMNVPPQYYNELLTFKEIRQCLSCQRILVVPEEAATEKEPEAEAKEKPPKTELEEGTESEEVRKPRSKKKKSSF